MNVQQKRRELFESTTTLPVGVEWNSDSKSYVGPNYWLAEYAWDALNKALDAVVIELPERDISSYGGADSEMGPSYEQVEGIGYNYALDDCRAGIESTCLGLKVKP